MPAADPFLLVCPYCRTPIDPTDPAVEIDFDAGFESAAAACPACGGLCPLAYPGG